MFPLCHRYFTNISIGGRDYSFNSDGYLSNPLIDVISYTNGRGWEEVSAQPDGLTLIIITQQLHTLTTISHPIKHANWLLAASPLLPHSLSLSQISLGSPVRSSPSLTSRLSLPDSFAGASSHPDPPAVRDHVWQMYSNSSKSEVCPLCNFNSARLPST